MQSPSAPTVVVKEQRGIRGKTDRVHPSSTDKLQTLVTPSVIEEHTRHAIRDEFMGRYVKRFNIGVHKEAVNKIPIIKG